MTQTGPRPDEAGDENQRLTVVIATRDRPELLRRALAGIEQQTWPGEIETICVFDRSVPDERLARSHGRRQVRVTANARTPGLAGGRNTGVMLADSRWVAFCDDDDEWLPDKIEAQLAALSGDPAARFVTCGIAVRYNDQDHVRIPDPTKLTFPGFLEDRMTEVHPSSFVFDRNWMVDEVGLIDEDLPGGYAEDYDFLLRASRASRIVSVPQALVVVHWHAATYFRERWTMIDEALGYLTDKFPEFSGHRKGLARIRGQQAFAQAAAGRRAEAARTAVKTLRLHPFEPRAAVAIAVCAGVPASKVLATLHRFGRGL